MTVTVLLQALVLAVPVIAGGILHVVVIKLDLLRSLARLPLDGGLTLRGRRLFGDNKTARGAVTMPAMTALASWAFSVALAALTTSPEVFALPVQATAPMWWGALLGAGYILGELPNSALKRQLDIAPGAPAQQTGAARHAFWLIDQLDFLLGIVVVTAAAGLAIPLDVTLTLAAIALVVHPAVAALMVLLGLKTRVG